MNVPVIPEGEYAVHFSPNEGAVKLILLPSPEEALSDPEVSYRAKKTISFSDVKSFHASTLDNLVIGSLGSFSVKDANGVETGLTDVEIKIIDVAGDIVKISYRCSGWRVSLSRLSRGARRKIKSF